VLHEVNEGCVNVLDEGEGHPLLLLHGLGGCWRDWEPQLDDLRERHRVVVIEHRGHGRSDRITGPVSTDLFAADVSAVCRNRRIDHARVVGLSMGGMIAQKLALAEPDLVEALVLCDTGTHLGDRASAWLRNEAARVRAKGFPDARGEVAGSTIWSRYTLAHQPGVARTNIREAQSTDPASWAEAALAVAAHDTRADVARIACPTLVIWGDEDPNLPPRLADRLAAALGGAPVVVLPDAGHVCNLEQPAAFDRAVEDFLAAHPCRRGS
jgi:3-oxoadipate enol-lactonase